MQDICDALGYDTGCVTQSIKQIYQVCAAAEPRPADLTSDFHILGPDSFQYIPQQSPPSPSTCRSSNLTTPHPPHVQIALSLGDMVNKQNSSGLCCDSSPSTCSKSSSRAPLPAGAKICQLTRLPRRQELGVETILDPIQGVLESVSSKLVLL